MGHVLGGVLPALKRTSRWIDLVGRIRTEHKHSGKSILLRKFGNAFHARRLFSPRISFFTATYAVRKARHHSLIALPCLAMPCHASFVDARAEFNLFPEGRARVCPLLMILRKGAERVKRNTKHGWKGWPHRVWVGFRLWCWWCVMGSHRRRRKEKEGIPPPNSKERESECSIRDRRA
jgi:hypothetical protein